MDWVFCRLEDWPCRVFSQVVDWWMHHQRLLQEHVYKTQLLNMYVYIYVYIYMCVYICIYMYTKYNSNKNLNNFNVCTIYVSAENEATYPEAKPLQL